MLIMVLLLLRIGFPQNLMDLLTDVLNLLNESGSFVGLRLNMGRICLCGCKRECDINGTQGLESQTHLKGDMADGAIESLVVVVLNIWKTLIPCTWILGFIHAQDVHNHLIDDLCFTIGLRVEGSGFGDLGVQQ
jgi:hypothetical protein